MTAPPRHRPHLVGDPPAPAPDTRIKPPKRARLTAWFAGWRARFTIALPMRAALAGVASVWALGAVWSYTEQTDFARALAFEHPTLLPLTIDGLAIATAGVAFAASLDGRPAIFARLMTVVGIAASATSNGVWAARRTAALGSFGVDATAVAVGVGIPLVAYIAFEVFLSELRRRVQRSRGMPAPVALPTLRLSRLLLAPPSTFLAWRKEVLKRTETPSLQDEPPQAPYVVVPDVSDASSEPPTLEAAAAALFEVAQGPVSRDKVQTILQCNTYQAKKLHAAGRPEVAR